MAEQVNSYITQDDRGLRPTEKGREYLERSVTNVDGNVYGFTDEIDPVIVAAAMARLSRFGGDLRTLLLKEFAGQAGQEKGLLHRVVTQFGDDSVQQLSTVPLVVENASNLLTKHLEWGRIAAYLEQSTRYIFFDEKVNGRYRYHTPEHFAPEVKTQYEKGMDKIFDNYSTLVRNMFEHYSEHDSTPEDQRDVAWRIATRGKACDAARGLLPVATASTVGIVGSAQAIDNMIMNLLSQGLPEAQQAGREILTEVRKQHGIFFERTDLENRGLATVEHKRTTRQNMARLARKLVAVERESEGFSAKLLDYTPHDETEVVAHMLYGQTSLGLDEIKKQLETWSDDELTEAMLLYYGERTNRRHKPGRALEVPHYTFDLVCDYGSFRDLQRHRMVDALEWQSLNHELGYAIPEDVKAAGYESLYHETHDIAKSLYDQLMGADHDIEAQYATLLGNNMRWKVTMNAREAFHFIELRTQPAGHPGYRRLVKMMYEEIEKVHPNIARGMIFVDRRDDDPNVSRLEQLRNASAKMSALGVDGLIE
ncbi:MAG: FAD-dependent thymidylate synthase [Candidatus Saccharimonadales bacterium]